MSKKKRRKQQKSVPLWPFITGGLLLILAILFAVFPSRKESGTPKLAVEPQRIDFGDLKLNTELTFTIKVTNIGDGTLRFKELPYIEVLEGCCPPRLTIGSMVLKPGESTVIRSDIFMMHAGMGGMHNFAVHLKTNDPQNPDLVVNVLSNWVP